jgi:hypothetical protein
MGHGTHTGEVIMHGKINPENLKGEEMGMV